MLGNILDSNNQQGISSSATAIYQLVILVVISLVVIYALREVHAKLKITAKLAFYRGMYPLIPSLIILLIIALEFIPLALGSALFAYFFGNVVHVNLLEEIFVVIATGALYLLSLYFLTNSIIAFYISTLPNMEPIQSLRLAKEMISKRRIAVFGRIMFLLLFLILYFAIINIPAAMISTNTLAVVEFISSLTLIIIFHSYMYSLYRSLI